MLVKKQTLVFLVSFIFPLLLISCANIVEGEKEEDSEKEMTQFGEIRIDPPENWQLYHEAGQYCLYLPSSFKPMPIVNDGLRQFQGARGTISVIFTTISSGKNRPKNATLDGVPITIAQTQPVADVQGYYDAKSIYAFYSKAHDNFYLVVVFYSIKPEAQALALQIFGTTRSIMDCGI